LIVLVLAVMWTAVLAPPLLRSRADGRPSSSVSSFRRQLSSLQRANPPMAPRVGARPVTRTGVGTYRIDSGYRSTTMVRPRPALAYDRRAMQRAAQRRRRQHVLVVLAGVVLGTGLVGFGMHVRSAMYANVIADLVLGGYLYLLVQIRRAEEEKAMRRMWVDAA
jgi:hypothetical protein